MKVKRTRTEHVIRGERVAARVEDWLAAHGGGKTASKAARLDAQKLFVTRAIRTAKHQGLRLWRESGPHTLQDVGLQRLQYLIGERSSTVKGVTYSGLNDRYILDVWEATLNSAYLLNPEDAKPLSAFTPEPEPEVTAPVMGVKVFVEENEVKTADEPRRFANIPSRIMTAFLAGDSEEIMRICLELEGGEIA